MDLLSGLPPNRAVVRPGLLQDALVKIAIRSRRNGRAVPDLPQHALLVPCRLNCGRNGVGILRHVDGVDRFFAGRRDDINLRDDGRP